MRIIAVSISDTTDFQDSPIIPKSHYTCTHTHTRLTAGTTQVSRYQNGKTKNLDFTEARDSERQWHQLGHMQVCTSLQADNHANTSPLSFFTGRMPFLPPNQQCQSTELVTEGTIHAINFNVIDRGPHNIRNFYSRRS